MAWNPAGTIIATGGGDGTLRLFDATTHSPTGNPIHTGSLSPVAVAWNPAGTTVATLYLEGTLALFDATNHGPIGFAGARQLHIGDGLEPGGHDHRHRQQTMARCSLSTRRRYTVTDPITLATISVEAVAWNPAGTIIATGNDDGTLRLFDATTRGQIGDPISHRPRASSAVAWNTAGTIIAASNGRPRCGCSTQRPTTRSVTR